MNTKLFIHLVIIASFFSIKGISQDIHFSQNDAVPLLTNPALTGYFFGDHRAILNYKDQWRSVGAPYKTYALQYDATLFKKKWQHRDKIGVGFSFFSDKAGDGNMGTTQANLLMSYYKYLTPNNSISLGVQGGFVQHSYDASSLTWDSQYDGSYNPQLSSNEPVNSTSFYSLDLAGGLVWDYRYDRFLGSSAGISLYHINPTYLNYYPTSANADLDRRLTIHGTVEKKLNKSETTFYPSFIFKKQGPAQEFIYGVMVKYQLSEEKFKSNILETAVNFGVYHRYGDSFIFTARMSYMRFSLGISYDVNASKLSNASSYKGGLEFSLIYITPYERRFKGNALL